MKGTGRHLEEKVVEEEQEEQEEPKSRSEDYLYSEDELDLIDQVPLPRLNPWLSLFLLILFGFFYIWACAALLRL